MPLSFEQKLANYTEVIVHVGLGLRARQRLIVQAPIKAAPVVRQLAESAYKTGARLVDVLWSDERLTLTRVEHALRDSFEEYPAWRARAMVEGAERGDAFLNIFAADPGLLSGQDPGLIATVQRTHAKHTKPFYDLLGRNASNIKEGQLQVVAHCQAGAGGASAETSCGGAIGARVS